MANVDMTVKYVTKPLSIPKRNKIYKDYGIDIPFEFEIYAEGTGDNTGAGYMMATLDFNGLANDLYFALTSIIAKTNDTGQTMGLLVNPSHWEKLFVPGITSVDIQLWGATQQYSGVAHQDQINGIMYLGKPRNEASSPGRAYLYYFDQAGVCHYRFQLSGFTMSKALAMSNMFQPNPIG